MVSIAVTPVDRDTEPVELGTFTYQFTFPKSAPLLTAIQKAARITDEDEQGLFALEARYAWLASGFGPDQWAHITGRLEDNEDPLDTPHMADMFSQLFKAANTSRPPTSPGDSSTGSPPTPSPVAKPSPYASTPGTSQSPVSVTS